MKDYIQIGIDKGLISFNEDRSRITYIFQKKERNYNNPEEKVQAPDFGDASPSSRACLLV